jgi:hypothetical protein
LQPVFCSLDFNLSRQFVCRPLIQMGWWTVGLKPELLQNLH